MAHLRLTTPTMILRWDKITPLALYHPEVFSPPLLFDQRSKFLHWHLTTPVILIQAQIPLYWPLTPPVILMQEKIPHLRPYHLCFFNIGENLYTSTSTSQLCYYRRQNWQAPRRHLISDIAENARVDTLPSLFFCYIRNQIVSPSQVFYAKNNFLTLKHNQLLLFTAVRW